MKSSINTSSYLTSVAFYIGPWHLFSISKLEWCSKFDIGLYLAFLTAHKSSRWHCTSALPGLLGTDYDSRSGQHGHRCVTANGASAFLCPDLCTGWVKQEAQLSPRDRAMRRVSGNLANCHATVQNDKSWTNRSYEVGRLRWADDMCTQHVHSTVTRASRFHCLIA